MLMRMLMAHQSFIELHSPSSKQVAQALVSWYWDTCMYNISDLNDGMSSIDDSMHIFNQPTNKDTLL